MSEQLLELAGVSAGYGNGPVIRNLALSVASGEVVSLLGPNGAGKTSTLRAIAGLLPLEAGTVRLFGNDTSGSTVQKLAREGLGYVMEGHSVFAGLTVDDHFRLRGRGQKIDSRVAYEYFPALEALRSRQAGLLSGGEQQMLAIASVLARGPRLILIDELSQGLAPVIVERILPVLRRYADEAGAGILLVEQRVHLALAVADRGALLVHGEIEFDRPAEQLRADTDLITASYLGSRLSGPTTGTIPHHTP